MGKNATDSALIIDAMDLLHGETVDGFCLVSSDSDFTRLATRIREAGLAVYGFGEKKTPKPFVAACDKFVFTEILRPTAVNSPGLPSPQEPLQPDLAAAGERRSSRRWVGRAVCRGISFGKASPSFDPRNYGFPKLGELVRGQPFLEVKSVPAGDGSPNVHLYVRLKET